VTDLVPDVLRHRLVLTYEALAEGLSADHLIAQIVHKVPQPDKPMAHHSDERAHV
jgi:MoxR-like ATPase